MKCRILLMVCCLWGFLPFATSALTTEEILLLKQNDVSEQTIQMMLQSEMQARRTDAAGDRAGVRTIIRPNGRPAIIYSTGGGDHDTRVTEERLKEERAWEMLRHIIVDTRNASGE
jgi:hypothetical protein